MDLWNNKTFTIYEDVDAFGRKCNVELRSKRWAKGEFSGQHTCRLFESYWHPAIEAASSARWKALMRRLLITFLYGGMTRLWCGFSRIGTVCMQWHRWKGAYLHDEMSLWRKRHGDFSYLKRWQFRVTPLFNSVKTSSLIEKKNFGAEASLNVSK